MLSLQSSRIRFLNILVLFIFSLNFLQVLWFIFALVYVFVYVTVHSNWWSTSTVWPVHTLNCVTSDQCPFSPGPTLTSVHSDVYPPYPCPPRLTCVPTDWPLSTVCCAAWEGPGPDWGERGLLKHTRWRLDHDRKHANPETQPDTQWQTGTSTHLSISL